MSIAIQRAEAREFLAFPPDDWVRDSHDALHFNDTRTAIAFCRRHGLENVRLVAFGRGNRVNLLFYTNSKGTPSPAGALKPALV